MVHFHNLRFYFLYFFWFCFVFVETCKAPESCEVPQTCESTKTCESLNQNDTSNSYDVTDVYEDSILIDFPFYVSLRKNGKNICGGAIIDAQLVLTAAQCLIGITEADIIQIVAGSVKSGNTREQVHKVDAAVINRNFDQSRFTNDIALLKIADFFKFNERCQIVDLPLKEQKDLLIGTADTVGHGHGNLLKSYELQIEDFFWCKTHYTNGGVQLDDKQICAGERPTNRRRLNAGSPLAKEVQGKNVLIGLTSFGREKTKKFRHRKIPTVFTDVSEYLDWIAKVGTEVLLGILNFETNIIQHCC